VTAARSDISPGGSRLGLGGGAGWVEENNAHVNGDAGNNSSVCAVAPSQTDTKVSNNDDEALGPPIYDSSRTARLAREKARKANEPESAIVTSIASETRKQKLHSDTTSPSAMEAVQVQGNQNRSKKGPAAMRDVPTELRRVESSNKSCGHEGCSNIAVQGGVCHSHGAKRIHKKCRHSFEGRSIGEGCRPF